MGNRRGSWNRQATAAKLKCMSLISHARLASCLLGIFVSACGWQTSPSSARNEPVLAAGTGAPSALPAGSPALSADTGAAGASAAGSADLPCEVSNLLKQHCLLCHDKVTQYTAPMSLVTWNDLTAPSKTMPALPVYQLMLERVQNATRPMPPQPMAALSAADIDVLKRWVSAGTPKGTGMSCPPLNGAVAPAAGGGGAGGMLPATAGSGAAGSPANDADVQCYKFLANGGGATKYAVPMTPDLYQCFYFDPPWGSDKVEGVSANYIVDNSSAIHHFILYTTTGGTANTTAACPGGAHRDGQFVVGWAPGAKPLKMPDDVGLVVPGPKYLLEAHYNATKSGQLDASGIELCVTRKLRAQAAATHPLGQEGFATTGPGDVKGTCNPKGPFPIHVLWSSPHMHLKGTRMQTLIHRADGTVEALLDKSFDFMNQIAYDTPMLINQGDTLETICSYNGPAQFGNGTNQEMCYNFVTAWPAGALAGGPGYTGLSGNGNICIKTSLGF
jgi:hypothetical protein